MTDVTKLEPRPPEVRAEGPTTFAAPPPESPRPPESPGPLASAPPPAPPTPPGRARRLVLRTAFALGVSGGTAAALVPVLRAGPHHEAAARPDEAGGAAGAEKAEGAVGGPPLPEFFDEMYRGRHLRGTGTGVRIDGRPLHLMRRADGGHVSVVNHVESFPTALAATRAAVDDLGGTRLVPAGPAPH
ncbi:tyrosinase cofactor [Streptomyces sp. NBC_01498]|uniref:tyrosinase family oxidase copper chaperone n=1 Tax=Streptomyces sp. NBC_01498 TaxID=2975870 RepID=UPI002E7B3A4A|nr:tyrosinase family oxidase copper chaperone [Streptomyces sp. NBC_01498]WTL28439.1 tyrosinase cofactor [Streptomyces sp. NBC_01498]